MQVERLYKVRPERINSPSARKLPITASALGAPKFKLRGLAIGNGLTDPLKQVLFIFELTMIPFPISGSSIKAISGEGYSKLAS